MFDIPQVVEGSSPILQFGFGGSAPAVDLRPAGDSRFDGVAHHIGAHFLLQGLIEVQAVWSWPHDGHIVCQYVEQLGEFVDAIFSKDLPEPGDALVALNGGVELVGVNRFVVHGAKLKDSKRGSGYAEPVGFEKDGPFTGQFDGDGDEQAEREQKQDHQGGKSDIKGSFKKAAGVGLEGEGPHLEERNIAQGIDFEMDLLAPGEIGNKMGADAVSFGYSNEVPDLFGLIQGQYDEGVFEVAAVEDLLEIVDGADDVMVQILCRQVGEQADGFDAKVFICEEVILKLGAQFVITDNYRWF